MSLPSNPLSQRRDIANGSKTRPINQAGCRDSRITQSDMVASMFQINLCHRFSQYFCWGWNHLELSGSGSWKSRFGCKHRHWSLTRIRGAESHRSLVSWVRRSYVPGTALWFFFLFFFFAWWLLNMLLLSDECVTRVGLIFHAFLMDAFEEACEEDLFFSKWTLIKPKLCGLTILFCERAGPHILTMHE